MAVNTTTTVTTTTSTRNGIGLQVDSTTDTVTIGDFVTDVAIQPYIANRVISFLAYNMRPNQRVHIFFDSVLVDAYCAPGIFPSGAIDTSDYTVVAKNGNWGDPIYTDASGRVCGQFNIPEATFKTGDRVLEITDVTNLAMGNDAMTTMSSATFTASNLNVTKKTVTLTTVNPEISVVPVTNTVITTNTVVTVQNVANYNVTAYWQEPIAQGLTINTPGEQAGIFASSIEVYFKQKAQVANNGVTLYLCEIENGYPAGTKILPFSTVHLDYADINVSEDASVSTKFTFEAPVFLNNNTEYAFVVRPDSNDPDYWVYSANLGDVDIATNIQVYSQPVVGTAFYGATANEWTALQTEYIKFKLNRAKFNQSSGSAVFYNSNTDFITLYNVAYNNTSVGILSGDKVFQATNATPSTSNTSISGTVTYYDSVRGILYVGDSTGNFSGNSFVQIHRFANSSLASSPNTTTIIAYGNTGSLHNPIVDAIVPQFATIAPAGTTLSFGYKGTSNAYVRDSNTYPVQLGYERELFDQERIVASKSNEVAHMSNNKSFQITATMTADSDYVSPAIDTVRQQQLVIQNQIDPISFIYEEFYASGNSQSKYVSQIVTLADGQDAQDLQVTLTAHRPPSTDIQVWVRFLNKEDTQPISQKTWTPLNNNAYDLFCDPSNPADVRDFTFTVPEFYSMIATTGTTTSTNASAVITGSGTLFGTEVRVGHYINMFPNTTFSDTSRQIIAIANTTELTLESPFLGNYTNQPYYIVPPVTTAWSSINTVTQLTGNVTTSTTNNAITGSGTAFATELQAGSIISINGDQQVVVSIANNTSLNVGTPWTSAVSGANAYHVTPAGLTYINKPNSLYNTFKQFQVKIVLQSNDTSKVPIIDDLRCLAMQL